MYLGDFFSPDGYREYEPSNAMDEKESCLLYSLFNGEDELLVRADKVLEEDPLCLEAFYIAYRLEDEVFAESSGFL